MKVKRNYAIVFCVLLLSLGCSIECAQILNGNLLSLNAQGMKIATDNATINLKPAVGAQLFRGQIGKELRPVGMRDFAPGDRIVATVNQKGAVVTVKAYYGIIRGVLSKVTSDKLSFKDGRSVKLSLSAQVTLPDGGIGKASELKIGSQVICRVNPSTGLAWMIISSISDNPPAVLTKAKPAPLLSPKKLPVVSQPVKVILPEIKSISYNASLPVVANDILTVNLLGTPNGAASFEINGLIPVTPMAEEKPGIYKATVRIPAGKTVYNAALVGRLKIDSVNAIPIQASRLLSVVDASKPAVLKPQVILAVNKPEVKIEPKAEPQVVTRAYSSIILTNPPNGAKIQRAVLVRGKAEPASKVRVTITYANGMTGILKLSGQLASESIAVDNDGSFRVGPIALEGPMATPGLVFTIKAYYPDRDDHAGTSITVVGNRN